MAPGMLYGLDGWHLFLIAVGGMLAATEVGFRAGRWAAPETPDPARSQVGAMQAAVLGLLALLLGFSFAMSAARYDARKQVVLDEANAIGTAHLRTRLLPQPERDDTEQLLRQYVDARVAGYQPENTLEQVHAANRELVRLQGELWARAAAAANKDTKAVGPGLFVASLNDVIDLHEKRIAALQNHVPRVVLVLLGGVALGALGLAGYGSGLAGRRNLGPSAAVAVLTAAVLVVVIDLDSPGRGRIRIGQQSFDRLRAGMAPPIQP